MHPSLHYLRVFGSEAWVHIQASARLNKLDARARKCVYIGVLSNKRGFKLMDLLTHRVIESRDVIFREDVLPLIATTTAAAAARKKTPADIGHPNGPDTSCMPDEVAEISEIFANRSSGDLTR